MLKATHFPSHFSPPRHLIHLTNQTAYQRPYQLVEILVGITPLQLFCASTLFALLWQLGSIKVLRSAGKVAKRLWKLVKVANHFKFLSIKSPLNRSSRFLAIYTYALTLATPHPQTFSHPPPTECCGKCGKIRDLCCLPVWPR